MVEAVRPDATHRNKCRTGVSRCNFVHFEVIEIIYLLRNSYQFLHLGLRVNAELAEQVSIQFENRLFGHFSCS